MFKIMIVDDELIILNGIKMMIENFREISFPIDIVTASNVPAAIEILSSFQPDLLLVDITMPVMNGFDLIRHIRANSYSMDIVILTSHANFDYAKEAITLQINDYLLKPVNIQSLIKAIQTSRDKKMAESDSARKQTLVSLRAMMLYDIPFSDLLLDTALLRDLFPYAYISVVVLEPGAGLKLPEPEVYKDIFLDFYDVCYPMIFVDRREVVFICNHAIFSVKTKALKERLIERLHSSDFALGTSISSSSCETLHQLYMNSVQRIFYQKAFPDTPALAGAALFTYNDCVDIFLNTAPDQIKNALNTYVLKLNSLTAAFSDRIFLEQICHSFFYNIYFYLDSLSISLPQFRPDERLPEAVTDLPSAIDAIADRILWIKQELKKQDDNTDNHEVIPHLVQYIKANYQKDLSLNDLAQEVNMNPNYLSGLFKKTISCSYLECLHHERLAIAKQLLLQTDLSMEQIAGKVGYNSSIQLLRIFKKYEHMLPSEFRARKRQVNTGIMSQENQ